MAAPALAAVLFPEEVEPDLTVEEELLAGVPTDLLDAEVFPEETFDLLAGVEVASCLITDLLEFVLTLLSGWTDLLVTFLSFLTGSVSVFLFICTFEGFVTG